MIRINAEDQTVSLPATVSNNPLLVGYFSQLPDGQRMQAFERAIAIGVMALRDERIAAFLGRTESELGLQLEFLKTMQTTGQLRQSSAVVKGESGEASVADALVNFIDARKLPDEVQLVGRTSGRIPRNKTGDILCRIGDGDDAPTIAVEVKLDKAVRLGDPSSDGLTKGRSDTAWSQLIETRANRSADVAIMVFAADNTDRTIGNFTDSVRLIDGVGYIVLVDIVRGDFRPLAIAYELARHQALAGRKDQLDVKMLDALMRKFCADLTAALSIKTFLEAAMANCKQAMDQVDTALAQASATHKTMQQFISTGKLDGQQLLELLVPHKAIA